MSQVSVEEGVRKSSVDSSRVDEKLVSLAVKVPEVSEKLQNASDPAENDGRLAPWTGVYTLEPRTLPSLPQDQDQERDQDQDFRPNLQDGRCRVRNHWNAADPDTGADIEVEAVLVVDIGAEPGRRPLQTRHEAAEGRSAIDSSLT